MQIGGKATTVTLSSKLPEIESILLYSLKNGENFLPAENLFNPIQDDITLTYTKINPTMYTVHVSAQKPFFLVLNEPYHEAWNVYIGDPNWFSALFQSTISSQYHFVANGNQNAWYITKTGDYTLTLYFWPQSLVYIGMSASLTTFAFCVLYFFKSRIKGFYNRIRRRCIDLRGGNKIAP